LLITTELFVFNRNSILSTPRPPDQVEGTLPSPADDGPAVMPFGKLAAVGIGNSWIAPSVEIRPITLPYNSVTIAPHPAPQ
jgi:hypothetical protein